MIRTSVAVALAALVALPAQANETKPELKSAGPLAFAPDGVLLVGDTVSAAVFAIETGDTKGEPGKVKLDVAGIDAKIAAALGTKASDILINDLAVNPASGNAYLSISRGRGPDAQPVIVRVDGSGKIAPVPAKIAGSAALPNAPAPGGQGRSNKRSQVITDLAWVDGQVIVAGLSNEDFASTLRSFPFPFKSVNRGTGIEVYHGAHGKYETHSPVRTFAIHEIKDEPVVLAAYTCTPLVRIPIKQLKPGAKVRGVTVAELGNRNRPLDMVVYTSGGKDYILMANSARGVMKISTEGIDRGEGITERIGGGGKAGQTYETIDALKDVVQLDRLNEGHVAILVKSGNGFDLKTVPLP